MWVINVLRCLFWMLAWLFGLFVSSLGWVLGFGCFGCLGLSVLVDLGSGDSDLLAVALRDLLFMVGRGFPVCLLLCGLGVFIVLGLGLDL